ncbi:MAG: hypothetical protein QNJ72_40795 [Pleurocapsa sp. MO_226.B13]|nr:hypothetical protein [Pleurocapsa sp. MO_226.B13]
MSNQTLNRSNQSSEIEEESYFTADRSYLPVTIAYNSDRPFPNPNYTQTPTHRLRQIVEHQKNETVMKRINNSSVYKLLGYLLLGIGAYAFLNANNTDLQANSTVTQEQTTYKRSRHTITLVLNQLSDLKVEEGQRINVGDLRARSLNY